MYAQNRLQFLYMFLPGLFEGVSHVVILDTIAYIKSLVPAYVSKTLLTSEKTMGTSGIISAETLLPKFYYHIKFVELIHTILGLMIA